MKTSISVSYGLNGKVKFGDKRKTRDHVINRMVKCGEKEMEW